ncbi:hypothetical protein [Nocardia sp. NPDC058705]|uniref:DUF7373 family lipoprotein n=1 Tax=Nocardia sp. NPDC058705 TaxID=3346609 RepID=UPI0036AB7A5E
MRRSDICDGFGALMVVALLSACTVPGSATALHPDLDRLDYGSYQHIPLVAPVDHDLYTGKVVESMRLGEVMINPAKADVALSQPADTMAAVPLPTPAKVAGVLSEQARAVLERHGMLAGFAVAGKDSAGTRSLTIVALRMPDAAAATKAAAEIDAADAAVNHENVAVQIARHPAAHAHWRPTVPSVAATVVEGAYVVSVLAQHPTTDLAALTTLVGKAFDAQLPELGRFVATAPEQLTALPVDTDGMLARLVPEKLGRWSAPAVLLMDLDRIAGGKVLLQASGVVFGPNAAYLWGNRESRSTTERFAMIGYDALKREPDAVTARHAFERSKRAFAAEGMRSWPGPAGTDDILCFNDAGSLEHVRYFCRVLHGRYVATVFAPTEQQVMQKAAAQYSLLVRAQ